MNAIKFRIEKNSPVPVVKQIQDQVKLSIAMGVLERGDRLPPIREVEEQTGVNRGTVHRAYLALRRSGLLSPVAGRRSTVAISAAAPDPVNRKCQELSDDIAKRIRRIGVSPSAFARYLGRSLAESERAAPFIAYVDPDKERAVLRAERISRLWNVPVVGLSADEFGRPRAGDGKIRKVLTNHLAFDVVARIPRRRTIEVIPVEIRYTEQTTRALGRIRASSLLVLLPHHAVPSARFIVEQLHQWVKCDEAGISWMQVDKVADFERLLADPRYERILVSPGARGKVPVELNDNARILTLQMDLDPEALEMARIRAGVIV